MTPFPLTGGEEPPLLLGVHVYSHNLPSIPLDRSCEEQEEVQMSVRACVCRGGGWRWGEQVEEN